MGRNKFITTRAVPDTDLKEALQKMREPYQARAGLDVAVSTGISAYRMADLLYTMARRSNPAYSDGLRATRGNMIGYAVALLPMGFHLWLQGSEVARRIKEGESLLSLESNEKVDIRSIPSEAVVIGINVAQIKNGRTLFHKREYSTYGRTFLAVTVAAAALRLGIQVRQLVK